MYHEQNLTLKKEHRSQYTTLKWQIIGQEQFLDHVGGRDFLSCVHPQELHSLNDLTTQSSQLGNLPKDGREVVRFLLSFAVIDAMVTETVDYFHLNLLHFSLIFQSVPNYNEINGPVINKSDAMDKERKQEAHGPHRSPEKTVQIN